MADKQEDKRKVGVEGRIQRRAGKAVASRRVFAYLAGGRPPSASAPACS